MNKLKNKVALVTGGSRGIGAAIVYALAAEGANIGLSYIANKESAKQVCERISKQSGVKAIALKADVSTPRDIANMIEATLHEFGKIDILVNNAGIMSSKKLIDTSLADWNRMITTDLTGVFLCTQFVLPTMMNRKKGRIINISSTLGLIGGRQQAAYSAAKGGVIAFTKAAARELAPYGIRVNCVAPGPTETDAMANATPEVRKAFRQATLTGYVVHPEEVAQAVVFLATLDSNAFFGQVLCPNNGEFML